MQRRPNDPTPDQIAARAAVIRESWDEREHYRRAGMRPPEWTARLAKIGDGKHEPNE